MKSSARFKSWISLGALTLPLLTAACGTAADAPAHPQVPDETTRAFTYEVYPTTTQLVSEQMVTTIGQLANFKLAEDKAPWAATRPNESYYLHYRPAGAKFSILERFIDKMVRRLNYGPEIGTYDYINVFIDFTSNFGGAAFGDDGTAGGYINFGAPFSILREFGLIDFTPAGGITAMQISFETFADFVAEATFHSFYHEYNHKFQNVYLKRNREYAPDQATEYGNVKFNTAYAKTLIDTLQLTSTKLTTTNPSQWVYESILEDNTKKITTEYLISNYVALNDLFKMGINAPFTITNDLGVTVTKKLYDVEELFPGVARTPLQDYFLSSPRVLANNTIQRERFLTDAFYRYNFEEIEVRSFQQATMLFDAPYEAGYGLQPNGYLIGGVDASGKVRAAVSNFLQDTLLYAPGIDVDLTSAPLTPFYDNYLFKKVPTQTGALAIDNTNAKAIYEARLKEMGYYARANISVINYMPSRYKTGTGVKFGGFLSKNLRSKKVVGYFNAAGQYVSVPIFVLPFNFKLKSALNSTSAMPLDETYDNDFYVLKDWIDVRAWTSQNLYFADDSTGLNAVLLTSVNPQANFTTPYNDPNQTLVGARLNASGAAELFSTLTREWWATHPYRG